MSADTIRLQYYRERLAGTLRALAEAPQLPVSFETGPVGLDGYGAHLPPLQQEPTDWTSWRALADRLALRYRYPPPLSRPLPGKFAPLVEALWQARAETMGARAWPGVASNLQTSLLECYGAPQSQFASVGLPERLGLIVHCQLGFLNLPGTLQSAIDCWKAELEVAGVHFEPLVALVDEPRSYAALSLRIARRLSRAEPKHDSPARQRPEIASSEPQTSKGRRRPNQNGRAETPNHLPDGVGDSSAYRIFSHSYDQSLRPGDLAGPDELGQLHRRLEAEMGPQRHLVARLARKLQAFLCASRPTGWRNFQEQGRLDPRHLHRLVTAPGWGLPYRQRANRFRRDTVVTLLLDNSASMRGQRIQMAALCADLLTRSLESSGIAVEVLGFTTVDWDGGATGALWREAGRPPNPGRIAARRHLLYKGADQPWRRVRNGLGLMFREDLLKENLDGEALEWAARRLLARPERRRILILLGDGVPHERATAAANGENYLRDHLQAVVQRLERHAGLELLAIGFGPGVQRNYPRAVRVRSPHELATVLTRELAQLLAGESIRGRADTAAFPHEDH